jgi:hypothetical protein
MSKKWSCMADSVEEIKVRKRDVEMEQRVFEWFARKAITQGKIDNFKNTCSDKRS